MNPTPTKEEAYQLAVMLSSGMPASDAFSYFLDDETRADVFAVQKYQDNWLKSTALGKAVVELQGSPWQDMTLEQRVKYAVDKHYAEMAYYLYSHNYAELTGADKTKADTCRAVLEAKLAGLAGKVDPLSKLYQEMIDTAKRAAAPAAFPVPIPTKS